MICDSSDKFESSAAIANLLIDFIYRLDKFQSIRARTALHDDSFLHFDIFESSTRLKKYLYTSGFFLQTGKTL